MLSYMVVTVSAIKMLEIAISTRVRENIMHAVSLNLGFQGCVVCVLTIEKQAEYLKVEIELTIVG